VHIYTPLSMSLLLLHISKFSVYGDLEKETKGAGRNIIGLHVLAHSMLDISKAAKPIPNNILLEFVLDMLKEENN